ncbi:MAG: multicopper oxidase domain-containing protein [Candidatus Peribacteria bacterium]|nr:MAG: multicopper oxidase domain-containing protein [Candidatus Peribacteria bacterium]
MTLRVINRISDIETTVHSHGLRGANTEDGVPVEMGGHDDPIGAGEELIYELEFPDEGVFWYHPHVREDLQQEMGLYGNYLIMSSEEAPVNREETVMLDDIFLDRHGEIVPFDPEVGDYSLMGRFGNMPLINGDTNYEITMQQGEVVRLYLTNVANVTPFNLGISPSVLRSDIVDPADIPQMKLIGGDIG